MVLLQAWVNPKGETHHSISKNNGHLDRMKKKMAKNSNPEEKLQPDGDPQEVGLSEDHGLAELVQDGTVFIEDDEWGAIVYPDDE